MSDIAKGSNVAFVFPGQGAQSVGMGIDIYETSAAGRRVFDQADEVLGFSLRNICFEGPEDTLTDTINAQPAIMVMSIACLEAFRERCSALGVSVQPSFAAGHSLGEYSALVAAGALPIRDAVALVRERGRLMKEADQKCPGAMAAIMGLDNVTLQKVCDEASDRGTVVIANYNCPGQTVISGEVAAVEKAMELAGAAGARRSVRLAITIASHSPLMREASASFGERVHGAGFQPAIVPLVGNVTAKPLTAVDDIKNELSEQLCSSVLWEQSVANMIEGGVKLFVEFGPGQVLAGLIKRINKDVRTINVNDAKSIGGAIEALGQV